jgi:hypothetical protein
VIFSLNDRRAGRCETSSHPELTRNDRIAILEQIARDEKVNPRERIAAIRMLEEMRQGEEPRGGFDDLDEVAERRARSRTPA